MNLGDGWRVWRSTLTSVGMGLSGEVKGEIRYGAVRQAVPTRCLNVHISAPVWILVDCASGGGSGEKVRLFGVVEDIVKTHRPRRIIERPASYGI